MCVSFAPSIEISNNEQTDNSFFTIIKSETTMELFRERLLKSATKQSDLIEIFAAMDRGFEGFFSKSNC